MEQQIAQSGDKPLQMATVNELSPQRVRSLLLPKPKKKVDERQLLLDFGE